MVSAYFLSGPVPWLKTASAESTHDLLVAYAAKDSDNDGLPDWEEAIYGTDPNNPHSVSPTLTDGEAVAQGVVKPKFQTATTTPVDARSLPGPTAGPSTLTDQFAQQFFAEYLATHGPTTPTPDEVATFVEQGITNFEANQVIPDAYNAGEVRVSGNGPDALLSYAAAAEKALSGTSGTHDQTEIGYFSDAVEQGKTGELAQVKEIGSAYSAMASAYIKLSVPAEAATPHLAIANALARLGTDISNMSLLATDPLRAFLGLAAYQKDAPALAAALANMDAVYVNEQVAVPEGVPGSTFYALLGKSKAAVQAQQ